MEDPSRSKPLPPFQKLDPAKLASAASSVVNWIARPETKDVRSRLALAEVELLKGEKVKQRTDEANGERRSAAAARVDGDLMVTAFQFIAWSVTEHAFFKPNKIDKAKAWAGGLPHHAQNVLASATMVLKRFRLDGDEHEFQVEDEAWNDDGDKPRFDPERFHDPRHAVTRAQLRTAFDRLSSERVAELSMLSICLAAFLVGSNTPGSTLVTSGPVTRDELLDGFLQRKSPAIQWRMSLVEAEVRHLRSIASHLEQLLKLLADLNWREQMAMMDAGWNGFLELFAASRRSHFAKCGCGPECTVSVKGQKVRIEHTGELVPLEPRTAEYSEYFRHLAEHLHKNPDPGHETDHARRLATKQPPIVTKEELAAPQESWFDLVDGATGPTPALLQALKYISNKAVANNLSADVAQRKNARAIFTHVLSALLLAELHRAGLPKSVLRSEVSLAAVSAMATEFWGPDGVWIERPTTVGRRRRTKGAVAQVSKSVKGSASKAKDLMPNAAHIAWLRTVVASL